LPWALPKTLLIPRSPDPLAGLKGPTSKERKGQREKEGRGGRGEGERGSGSRIVISPPWHVGT